MKHVLIVGGGASGLLVAINIFRLAKDSISIEIAEPREVLGQGLAYSTTDEAHLLNVPAGRMSAFPDQPSHFVDWAGRDNNYFAPRKEYGRYLLETFAETKTKSPRVNFEHRRLMVRDISPSSSEWEAEFSDGSSREYNQVVLAMGHGLPLEISALKGLRDSARYQADPWRESSKISSGTLIGVGTGLTFIDLALSHLRTHPENRVIGISRNGLLPEAHLAKRAEPLPVPSQVRSSARAVREFIDNASDWRAAQDGVRHELPDIWFSWNEEEKKEFFAKHLRWWNVHRHRVSPEIQLEVEKAIGEERLQIVKDEVEGITEGANQVVLHLKSGASISGESLVNCLGYDAWKVNCLLSRLMESGVAVAGPMGLGIQSDFPRFNVKSSQPGGHPNLYAIGPILLGERFETTAIPELKEQALEIARRITSSDA
ncbi:MAG: hypothetical protein FGM47_00585 [Candidatus Nanopelagicaceae bacterium]|nr:hypothetical protein [Candidatus Nanopelagicaceae bacterium]